MTEIPANSPLSQFRPGRVLIPVAIGIGVSLYLIFVLSKIDTTKLSEVHFTHHLFYGLLLAIATVVIRDIAYIYRMWLLTDGKLSFYKCFEVIMLWEFGSSVTPASVGGVTAIFVLRREQISFGRGAAIVVLCSYMDNIAFVTVFTSLFLTLGYSMFDLSATCSGLGDVQLFNAIRVLARYAWIGFALVAIIGGAMGFAIFVKPNWARSFFNHLATMKWLHRWRAKIELLGEEIWLTSKEFKTKGNWFLVKVLIATIISWCSRYLLANALIWALSEIDLQQIAVFARQCLLRVIIFIPATPGGSGISEVSFIALNCDYLPAGLAPAAAIIWRLFNFYLYLAIGAIVLPRWLARTGQPKAQ